MGMGLLACVCGLIKSIYLKKKKILTSSDHVFEGISAEIWGYSEVYIGIIAANILCLKSLLEKAMCAVEFTFAHSKGDTLPKFVLSNDAKWSMHDRDTGYHCAVRSITRPGSADKTQLSDESFSLANKAKMTRASLKDMYVTKEYNISWEEKEKDLAQRMKDAWCIRKLSTKINTERIISWTIRLVDGPNMLPRKRPANNVLPQSLGI